MPLVAHSPLPTFENLRLQGQEILTLEHALHQDIRELHIGLLNMMPNAALTVTEQQFMRLLGSSNQIAQFYVYPFSIPGLPRSREMQAYIDEHYATFEQLKQEGLDALVITGANMGQILLEQEPFWQPLQEVIAWATEDVTSVLCSCLATHLLWCSSFMASSGSGCPPRSGASTPITLPRNHIPCCATSTPGSMWCTGAYNAITRAQLEAAGLSILVEGDEGGVHMAVSPDQFRLVYFQGHPEYDYNSLLQGVQTRGAALCGGRDCRVSAPP